MIQDRNVTKVHRKQKTTLFKTTMKVYLFKVIDRSIDVSSTIFREYIIILVIHPSFCSNLYSQFSGIWENEKRNERREVKISTRLVECVND